MHMHVQMRRLEGVAAIGSESERVPGETLPGERSAEPPDDIALVEAVRGGDLGAFGVLYQRHLDAARRAAVSLSATAVDREDLIAEAFTQVLRVIRAGGGPTDGFRAYLLTAMRNTVFSWHRRRSAVVLCAEVPETRSAAHDDPVGRRAHATVAADAFASLPERWRFVLWHTEVEGSTPAQIAPMLRMTPNSVAALAYRAREGLRQAYLRQGLPAAERRACRTVIGQLAGWVRHGCANGRTPRITAHLATCVHCRGVAEGVLQVNEELPAAISSR